MTPRKWRMRMQCIRYSALEGWDNAEVRCCADEPQAPTRQDTSTTTPVAIPATTATATADNTTQTQTQIQLASTPPKFIKAPFKKKTSPASSGVPDPTTAVRIFVLQYGGIISPFFFI